MNFIKDFSCLFKFFKGFRWSGNSRSSGGSARRTGRFKLAWILRTHCLISTSGIENCKIFTEFYVVIFGKLFFFYATSLAALAMVTARSSFKIDIEGREYWGRAECRESLKMLMKRTRERKSDPYFMTLIVAGFWDNSPSVLTDLTEKLFLKRRPPRLLILKKKNSLHPGLETCWNWTELSLMDHSNDLWGFLCFLMIIRKQ